MGGYSGVLEGLKLAEQKRQANLQAQVEREKLQAENQLRLEQIKQQQDRIKEEQRQFNAQHDLAIQAANLVKRAKALEFMKAEQGLSPSATSEMTRAVEEPKLESDIKRIEAQTAAQGGQQRLTQAEGFMYDKHITKMREDAANWRASLAANTDRYTAGLRLSATAEGLGDFNIEPYITGAATGDVTREDILKIPSKKISLQVMGALSQMGVTPVTQVQKDWLDDFKASADTIKYMDQFLDIAPKTGSWIGGKFGGALATANKDIQILGDELAGRGSILARVMMKEKGALSNRDIERAKAAYTPSRFDAYSSNLKRRNDFRRDLESLINSKLSNLDVEQRNSLKEKLGLLNSPLTYRLGNQSSNQPTSSGRVKIISVE